MINLFTGSQWSSSPAGYWTIQYEYRRSGADMQYRFYWNVYLGSASWFYDGLQLQLFLNGSQYNVTVKGYNTSEKGWNYSGTTGWYTVSNKTSGTTPFYAKLKDTNTGGIKVTSSTFNLAVAPAYATSNQSLASKTETTITMNWSSDNIIDMIAYKLNGGSWVYINVADGTSGSYTITGLSANTTYSIVTSVRRRDSQLWTDSSALSVATYNYPYVSAVGTSALVIGNSQTLTLYNPLGRSVTVKMYQNSTSGTLLYSGSTSGTSITFTPTASTLYTSIPNSQSGNCVYSVVYGSVTNTTGSYSYKVKGTEKPSTCTVTYKDSNTTVAGITGNNQLIVQNKSNLQVTYTEATANNGASISKYTFELNGVTKTSTSKGGTVDFGAVNSSTDLTLKVTITDSRGLTSSMELTISMLEYSSPIVRATLERLNNYENESYLTVDATISSVNNGNTMDVKYKYKESGGSYGSEVAITNGVEYTLNCNNEKSFIFSITVTDEFESTTKEFILDKGKFPLYIDTELNAVGINEFPIEGEALRVARGRAVFTEGVTFRAEATQDGFVSECDAQFNKGVKIGGNLTGKYLTGTWLQTTAVTDLGSKPPKVAVLDGNGWVYSRTLEELIYDLTNKKWGCACSARGSANSLSLSAGTVTALTLNTWNLRNDTGFKFSGGGIKCPYDGTVRISGSVYISPQPNNTVGCYIKKGTTEIFSTLTSSSVAGGVSAGTKIIDVTAGDVIYLCARSIIANTCIPQNNATYLDIEYIK